MIEGIGVDICCIKRIGQLYAKTGGKFVDRILTDTEKKQLEKVENPIAFLAKRFAAKEAVSKALGTGIGKDLSFQEIEIQREHGQKPCVLLYKERYANLKMHISISDEKEYAIAYVIAER